MLVDPSGIRMVYRKAHLWDAEADFFTPGDQPPPVVATRYGAIAMMICYDAEFPEWVRLPALAGANVLAVPANWPAEPAPPGERPMVTANIGVAAFANRMFVAAACRCGDERGVAWTAAASSPGRTATRWPARPAPRARRAERARSCCSPTATFGWPGTRPQDRATTRTPTAAPRCTADRARSASAARPARHVRAQRLRAMVRPSPIGSSTRSTRSSARARPLNRLMPCTESSWIRRSTTRPWESVLSTRMSPPGLIIGTSRSQYST